jgi:hypothetical protein
MASRGAAAGVWALREDLTSSEMSPRQLHRAATFTFCAAMAGIGIALIAQGLLAHAGVIATRLLLGALFVAAGVVRGYLELRRGREQ